MSLEDYVRKYLPHFLLIGDYAINPVSILAITPSTSRGCKIDILHTTTLYFEVTCAGLLEMLDSRSRTIATSDLLNQVKNLIEISNNISGNSCAEPFTLRMCQCYATFLYETIKAQRYFKTSMVNPQDIALPPSYTPVTFAPFHAPASNSKRFYFVNIANISYVSSVRSMVRVQLAKHSQRKTIALTIPPGITFDQYISKFLPHFILIGNTALNPANILEVYPGAANSTKIDMVCEIAGRGEYASGTETVTLEFNTTCGEVLEKICLHSSVEAASQYPTVDIGFGQRLTK
ncbi:hypothetical protein HDV06_005945 [Boothiomyces sp. JEL0866]|nr:hypothetical protein HDV06_005945 [Boothiomyces sp. JEL0866]